MSRIQDLFKPDPFGKYIGMLGKEVMIHAQHTYINFNTEDAHTQDFKMRAVALEVARMYSTKVLHVRPIYMYEGDLTRLKQSRCVPNTDVIYLYLEDIRSMAEIMTPDTFWGKVLRGDPNGDL